MRQLTHLCVSGLIVSDNRKMSHAPDNWREVSGQCPTGFGETYNLVLKMRIHLLAPVDVAGSHVFSYGFEGEIARFRVLIALILSPRTKDQAVFQAMKKLTETIGCDVDSLRSSELKDIEEAISLVNFNQAKAKYLKASAEMIHSEFSGLVPKDKKDLLKLPGVGDKVASLFLNSADNQDNDIAIDTHLQRIFGRWKWTSERAKTPTAVSKELRSWLPRELWKDINQVVVGFGQVVCSFNPSCHLCLLKSTCPSSSSTLPSADIEDLSQLLIKTRLARSKLIEEFGLPPGECEWKDTQGKPLKTKWLNI